ncbi:MULTISPECIES: methylated-DNA--[protein]-cysteine S-methyltransferase [unclassified Veillonella]|uniref:methylated-DNA--[protein]-cysteine S-methyltransferase n=1 Tax=unclassified Veillonella TaxID=2630086 RepID=UPI000F8D0561|nr:MULTISPECIES: methylated-DNA--[protein]-cysteine S-methyltransferase [unclassified Veillonella]
MSIIYTTYESPLGTLTLYANASALVGLTFPTQSLTFKESLVIDESPSSHILQQTIQWLDQYFNGQIPTITIPLSPQGTTFQQNVWSQLQHIPYGTSLTYGQLSQRVFNSPIPKGSQAIGSAVGANPISLIIPCHRVLGKGKTLTGYTGGLSIKRALLSIENIDFVDK